MNTPTIVWIHGANQTSKSFKFLKNYFTNVPQHNVEYSSSNRFYQNLTEIENRLDPDEPMFIVGHSLGGIYALHLQNKLNIKGVVTLATPFGGSLTADWARLIFPSHPLFKDVGKFSRPILDGHKIPITVPWLQIVSTTGGVPYVEGKNDGVVSLQSMKHRENDMSCIEMPVTHYEIVVSDQVANIISLEYSKAVTR